MNPFIYSDSASQAGSVAPTAQELEELFEELDNLSDSGPEMVMDNLSIVSNPRPSLQPYFASREMLTAISDCKVLIFQIFSLTQSSLKIIRCFI